MRVVLDANVFVSAAIRSGPSHRIVQRWFEGGWFELVMCPELLAEIDEVLTGRERLRKWIDLPTAERFVDTIRTLVDLVPDPLVSAATTRDRDDDYLVALAQTQQVDYIVTGDQDLHDWAGQRPPVITPAVFETLLAATEWSTAPFRRPLP